MVSEKINEAVITSANHVTPQDNQKTASFGSHNEKEVSRSKLLVKGIHDGTPHNIIFSDAKLFTVEQTFNHQNDCALSTSRQLFPATSGKCLRNQHQLSFGQLFQKEESLLVFVLEEVKIDKGMYIEDILEGAINLWCNTTYVDEH